MTLTVARARYPLGPRWGTAGLPAGPRWNSAAVPHLFPRGYRARATVRLTSDAPDGCEEELGVTVIQ